MLRMSEFIQIHLLYIFHYLHELFFLKSKTTSKEHKNIFVRDFYLKW